MDFRTMQETKIEIEKSEKNWLIPFMEFVDDFRRVKDIKQIAKPYPLHNDKFDSLLASTVEYLCDEMKIETPEWVWAVPACKQPWFVSGYENLKATAIAESPVFFRRRNIFVLENFLYRV